MSMCIFYVAPSTVPYLNPLNVQRRIEAVLQIQYDFLFAWPPGFRYGI